MLTFQRRGKFQFLCEISQCLAFHQVLSEHPVRQAIRTWPHLRPSLQHLQGGTLRVDFPHPGSLCISGTHISVLTQPVAVVMSSLPKVGRQNKRCPSQHPTCTFPRSWDGTGGAERWPGAAPSPRGGRGTRVFTRDLIPAALSKEEMLDRPPSVNF